MRHMSQHGSDPEDWDKLHRSEVECPNCKHSIPMYYSKERDAYLSLGLFCRACDTPYSDLFVYARLN